jgi:hypothetical protein
MAEPPLGLRCSMSRRGNCLDSAPIESFFGSLKTELVHRTTFPTREAARRALFEYVETLWAGWAIGVTEATYYRWRQEFGGLKLDQVCLHKKLQPGFPR